MAVGSRLRGPLILIWSSISFAGGQSSECTEAGYTSELRCSTCEALDDFLGSDSQLCTTCRRCCTSDTAPQYVSARIEGEAGYLRRLAGRLETGADSFTDPLMAGAALMDQSD